MLRNQAVCAALGIGVLAACGTGAPPPKGDAAESGATLREIKVVQHVTYSADGKSLLVEYKTSPNLQSASAVGAWDMESGKFRVGMEKPPTHCEQIAWSPDGSKAAAVAAGDRQLKVWDASTGKAVQEWELPAWKQFTPGAPFLAFSTDGTLLTSVLKQKVMRVKLGGEVKMLPDEVERWSQDMVAFSPAADLLAFASNPPPGKNGGGTLQVFDLSKPGEPKTVPLDAWVASIAVTPDGKTLAVAYEGGFSGPGKIELWDPSSWKVASTLPLDKRKDFWCYRRLFISPDGKLLAGTPKFGRESQTAMELIASDGKILREISGAKLVQLNDVEFSPDGKTAAVVVRNKPIQFLDTATGKDKEP